MHGNAFIDWNNTHPKDVGNIIRMVFNLYQGGWFQAAEQAHTALGGKSAGNGSLMRCLPVALVYPDEGRMVEVTTLQSKMTHFDPMADEACVLYNKIACRVLQGIDVRRAIQEVISGSPYEVAMSDTPNVPPDGFVRNTFLWVIHIICSSPDFESVVQRAANLGGDSDTIGAIAGGLAGLACGYDALPKRYVNQILVGRVVDEIAEELCRVRGN